MWMNALEDCITAAVVRNVLTLMEVSYAYVRMDIVEMASLAMVSDTIFIL